MTRMRLRSLALVAALAGAAWVPPMACAPQGSTPADDTDDTDAVSETSKVLASVAGALALTLDDAAVAFGALAEATEALAADPESEALLTAAQAAWREAFLAWQVAELMQVGPAGSSLGEVGGADLRDEVYSWPSVNRCQVDQATVIGQYADDDFFPTALVPLVGLDALETLLFSPANTNGCLPSVSINRDGTWAALGASGVASARAAYAERLADRLVDRVDALRAHWQASEGSFRTAFASGSEPYTGEAQALEVALHALFYIETATKDRKLGRPLGLVGCLDAPCPEDAEAKLAGVSVEAVAANLEGFERFVLGADADAFAFDDLLRAHGHGDVADALTTAIADARTAADADMPPLYEAASNAEAEALYAAVKAITDLLKGDVTTALKLSVPSESAGDTD